MSISSILSSLAGTSSHGAVSTRPTTSTAAQELQKLFAKLHMDAIASAGTSATSAASSTAPSATSSPGGAVTDGVHSLRHILDGGITVAKDARSAAKAATAYAHGKGVGTLASQVVDRLG